MNKLFKIIKNFLIQKNNKKLLYSFVKNKQTLIMRGRFGEFIIHECFCNELILADEVIKNTPEKNKLTVICDSCRRSVFFDKKAIKNLGLCYGFGFINPRHEITIYTHGE